MAGILRVDQANVDYIYAKTAGGKVYVPGHIMQVVYARSNAKGSTTSATPVAIDGAMDLVITPTSVNSKIFVAYHVQFSGSSAAYNNYAYIYRNNATQLTYSNCYRVDYNNNIETTRTALIYLDSPSSTSAVRYSLYCSQGSSSYNLQYNYATNDNGDWGYSYAYAMEVAQ